MSNYYAQAVQQGTRDPNYLKAIDDTFGYKRENNKMNNTNKMDKDKINVRQSIKKAREEIKNDPTHEDTVKLVDDCLLFTMELIETQQTEIEELKEQMFELNKASERVERVDLSWTNGVEDLKSVMKDFDKAVTPMPEKVKFNPKHANANLYNLITSLNQLIDVVKEMRGGNNNDKTI